MPGRIVLENLCTQYTKQEFSPVIRVYDGMASSEENSEMRQETVGDWHLDIDKRHLRWDSYVKAAYHVRDHPMRNSLFSHSGHTARAKVLMSWYFLFTGHPGSLF